MQTQTYAERRNAIHAYFDRTAAEAWSRLTSDAPVSRIRATVRAGRDTMRQTLLDWLPHDLSGRRVLDAGCGTGALSVEAARRGAEVVAIDIAETLVDLARQRAQQLLKADPGRHGRIEFRTGDMLDPGHGRFDHVVAMDSLIHYAPADMVAMLGKLSAFASASVVFTFAPRTPALSMMHAVGRFFPRRDRAPAIVPVDASTLCCHLAAEPALFAFEAGRTRRVDSKFYTSQAMELRRR